MRICVFLGPTLPVEEARRELDAVYLPPVSQGDVYLAARDRPEAIGIVDGYFERVPAVWHKEVLWALSRGIHVLGSASMGALRAAELTAFGMEGVGEVFAAFHRGELEDDDEVAVVHAPAEAGYRTFSEAMVNIRFTLRAAADAGVVAPAAHEALVRIAKALFYPERTYARLLSRGREQGLPEAELNALEAWLPDGRVDRKRLDAVAMLRRLAELRTGETGPKSVRFSFQHTEPWKELRREADRRAPDPPTGAPSGRDGALVEELRLLGEPYVRASTRAAVRTLALELAHERGMKVDEPTLVETSAAFRLQRGLAEPRQVKHWLREHDLDGDGFVRLMREEALVRRIRTLYASAERGLEDHLRLAGRYRELAERARHKQQVLAGHALENPGLADVELSEAELWRWYFEEHLGGAVPESVETYARDVGFANVELLRAAVVRELCYQRLASRDAG